MWKRSIHGPFSTNCIAAVPRSKRPYSGSVARKLTMEPISAIQRTARAWSSRPSASSTAPKAIGVQMAKLKSPICYCSPLLEPVADHRPADEIRHQHDHAQQHGEGVVVDVAGLHPARRAREQA